MLHEAASLLFGAKLWRAASTLVIPELGWQQLF